MKNRFMLAPLTNCQSHPDGRLSDDEFRWLTMRAKGNFGLTMTCAAHVQKNGQGFPGQLGIFSDDLLSGHQRLAKAIQDEGSLAVIQLHHAGMRSPKDLIGEAPVCPSADEKTGSRALTLEEVQQFEKELANRAHCSPQLIEQISPLLMNIEESFNLVQNTFRHLLNLWDQITSTLISKDELDLAKIKLNAAISLSSQTTEEIINRKVQLIGLNMDPKLDEKLVKRISKIDSKEILETAQKYLLKPSLSICGKECYCNQIKKIWHDTY